MIDATKLVRLVNPEQGEENYLFVITNLNEKTGMCYIMPINSGLPIPGTELVSVDDVENLKDDVESVYLVRYFYDWEDKLTGIAIIDNDLDEMEMVWGKMDKPNIGDYYLAELDALLLKELVEGWNDGE